jgi:hypothetical protein
VDSNPADCSSQTAEIERLLDLERIDEIVRRFLPLATDQTQVKDNYEACAEAAEIVLDAIRLRAKLLRYGEN